jgi:hypothetical protein
MLRSVVRCLMPAVLLAAAAAAASAQPAQTGTISGTIQDASGGVMTISRRPRTNSSTSAAPCS